jgi:tRNA (guanine-N7-)-methyltransferase
VSASIEVATRAGVAAADGLGEAGLLDRLAPGTGPWELEVGFGKGRFLLARAASLPERRFLGLEVAGEYFRLAAARLARRGLDNVALLHGEALYLLAAVLPRGFASVVHVYFPDPWPKSRHHRRRLFSPASVDLLLGALAPGGRLCFATDFLDYGAEVAGILAGCSGVAVTRLDGGWPDGPRTNYEAKYVAEGRPILRLESVLAGPPGRHPEALAELALALASSERERE